MERENAILVGLDLYSTETELESSLDELSLLADTAGANTLDRVIQKKDSPDPAYYIGKGKAEEISALVEMRGADLVIFDNELSPSQLRNLDRIINAKVVDRTALILDIFARRALSREGKMQVELAQLQYMLPRLTGIGNQLSRLGGGIGTRGPGETQLEVDRRVIRRKISDLKKEINLLRKQRSLQRQRRKRNRCIVISLVGYTNAGKSTLLNSLTGSNLYTEDKLFATLDPMVRRGMLENRFEVLFTDTVGFIEKLPHQLITAFRATLEEISAADILMHVVDISHPEKKRQIDIVREHLSKITVDFHQKELIVFNKTDLLDSYYEQDYLKKEYPGAQFISAQTGEGAASLKENIIDLIKKQRMLYKLCLPYSEGKIIADLQSLGEVENMSYSSEFLEISITLDPETAEKYKQFIEYPNDEKENK